MTRVQLRAQLLLLKLKALKARAQAEVNSAAHRYVHYTYICYVHYSGGLVGSSD